MLGGVHVCGMSYARVSVRDLASKEGRWAKISVAEQFFTALVRRVSGDGDEIEDLGEGADARVKDRTKKSSSSFWFRFEFRLL